MRASDPILLSRLDAINDSQKRSRFAWFLCLFASGAILAGLWNLYASWDMRWASESLSTKGAAGVLQQHQIGAWVDANTVGVDLLGIKLSTSDAAVLGTVVLLIAVLYQCLCARRENHEIGALILDCLESGHDTKNLIYRKVSAFMVVMASDTNDAPFVDPFARRRYMQVPLFHNRWALLVFLPAITALITVLSDVYYAVIYVSPVQLGAVGAWSTLMESERVKLVMMDVSGAVLAYVIWRYCRYITAYREATEVLVQGLGSALRRSAEAEPTQRALFE